MLASSVPNVVDAVVDVAIVEAIVVVSVVAVAVVAPVVVARMALRLLPTWTIRPRSPPLLNCNYEGLS